MIYEKNKSHRITLRLSDEQFNHVKQSAEMLGVSPSDFLRMVVNAAMYGANLGNKAAEKIAREWEEENRRENEASVQHDIV